MRPSTRAELAELFMGEGVELGVALGYYSSVILERSRCARLWSIDRWSDHHDFKEYIKASVKLITLGAGRCIPLRLTFSEALGAFRDESLDFVYIDGYAHTGQEGGKTLTDWWLKLKPGGIFAGHDYDLAWNSTMVVVDRFVAAKKLALNVTERGSDEYQSWWVRK